MPRIQVLGLQKDHHLALVEGVIVDAVVSVTELGFSPVAVAVYLIDDMVPRAELPVQVEIRVVKKPERTRELLQALNRAVRQALVDLLGRKVTSVIEQFDQQTDIMDY